MENIARIGDGRVMWSTDYPHPEGVMGSSDVIMKRIFDTVGESAARKVLGDTAAQLWGI
jgi:predicted TIM-barrel fold metal-dependent hydrolase